MLHVVTAKEGNPKAAPWTSRFTEDLSRGIVVIESDCPLKNGSFSEAFAELDSMDARQRAIGFANANGIADARVNGNTSGAYPVNSKGVPLDQVRGENNQPLPPTHEDMKVHRYRVDVPITRRLV